MNAIAIIPPRRERNGRIQRSVGPLAAQIDKERRDRERQEVQSVVLAQPHRKGNDSPWCEDAFGRFCQRWKVAKALYDAGEDYSGTVRRWRAAMGVPTDVRLGTGTGGEPDGSEVKRMWAKIEAIENDLKRIGARSFLAVRHLVIDRQTLPDDAARWALDGLLSLARHLDYEVGDHPFAR